ncbi:MAG: hypothetical protein RIF44_04920 [Nitratireductor sp.]
MAFSLAAFLRRTPQRSICAYLEACLPDALEGIALDRSSAEFHRSISAILKDAPQDVATRVYSDFEAVQQLADEAGRSAMRSVVATSPDFLNEFDLLEDPRACGLWLLGISRERFENAQSAAYANRTYQGRSWAGYRIDGMNAAPFQLTEDARARFEQEVRAIFQSDAGGGRCLVEWFDRVLEPGASDGMRRCVQATIYREDAPRSELRFAEADRVESIIHRPVAEAAVVFDPKDGVLDVCARGGKKVLARVAEAFCDALADAESQLTAVELRRLDLAGLARRPELQIRSTDGVEAADVEHLRFSVLNGDGLMVVAESRVASRSRDGRDLYRQMDESFGLDRRLGWQVSGAKIRVTFRPKPGSKRPKRVLVELNAPNRTNLRDQTEEHRFIANELLERWGLYEARR